MCHACILSSLPLSWLSVSHPSKGLPYLVDSGLPAHIPTGMARQMRRYICRRHCEPKLTIIFWKDLFGGCPKIQFVLLPNPARMPRAHWRPCACLYLSPPQLVLEVWGNHAAMIVSRTAQLRCADGIDPRELCCADQHDARRSPHCRAVEDRRGNLSCENYLWLGC